ncbi:MAG: radical SAM protein, partial [Candidatus Altiarchaeota archaeon]|nr:radical SAM protein [Candidatus Altiarchaeota archaeon]
TTTHKTTERRDFIDLERVRKDMGEVLGKAEIDIITLSGTGEPTLAKNLGEAIDIIRELTDIPIAILTNSTLLHQEEVRNELKKLDHVIAKLDAPNQEILEILNRPAEDINFNSILSGIKEFRDEFKGKFSLQIMFIEDNKNYADEMALLAREFYPDEVQLNTPLRPCPVKPLSSEEMNRIAKEFKDLNTVTVYTSKRPEIEGVDKAEVLRRRPE